MPLHVDARVAARLDEIPSQTSQAERRYLYKFFRDRWTGQGDVVEIGPYLGGTTRAIAMGMMANARRCESSRLRTFDRFDLYVDPKPLLASLAPHFDSGALDPRVRAEVARTGAFRGVFEAFHDPEPYASLIVAEARSLPELASEVANTLAPFELGDCQPVDAAFVDGCKSWFSTKFFMTEALAKSRPGAEFIFQDYGWLTCFWIPVFIEVMSEHFDLTTYVDGTYAFRYSGGLDASEIARKFPDTPEAFGRARFDETFGRLADRAHAINDADGALCYRLQHAGAVAYLGELDEARSMIDKVALESRNVPRRQMRMIEISRKTPTYRPNGKAGEPIHL